MIIHELSPENYHEIKPLWEALNRRHLEGSSHFKDHFSTFTFAKRMATLENKDKTCLFASRDKNRWVGYCLASMDRGTGEIDSIYLDPTVRSQGLGSDLIQKALDWFDANNCKRITVAVAEGNESVVDFYKQFDFYPRFVVLQRK